MSNCTASGRLDGIGREGRGGRQSQSKRRGRPSDCSLVSTALSWFHPACISVRTFTYCPTMHSVSAVIQLCLCWHWSAGWDRRGPGTTGQYQSAWSLTRRGEQGQLVPTPYTVHPRPLVPCLGNCVVGRLQYRYDQYVPATPWCRASQWEGRIGGWRCSGGGGGYGT